MADQQQPTAAPLVTRTLRDGRQLAVVVEEYTRGRYGAVASIDGAFAARGGVLELDRATARKLPGYTHYLAHSKAPVALRADEAATLLEAIEAANRAYTQTDDGRQEALRRERERLVSDYRGATEDQADAYERAHAREDVLAWDVRRSWDGRIAEARAALAAFDAAHPEIVEEIRAEKQAAAERHRWD